MNGLCRVRSLPNNDDQRWTRVIESHRADAQHVGNGATMENNDRSGPFWDLIEGRRPLPPASRLLGWKLLTLDPVQGTIRVEFAAVPDFINPIGTIQAG